MILSDIKASRKHAELSVVGGVATITDLGSSHGFAINGVQQKQAQLKSGDKVGLGGTVLEFIGSVEFGATQMIMRPPVQAAKVIGTINSQSGLTQFIPRPVPAGQQAAQDAQGKPKKEQGFLEKNKKLVLMLMVLMALTGGRVQQVDQRRQKKGEAISAADRCGLEGSGECPQEGEDTSNQAFKEAEIYFAIGKRELRAENWLRAETTFQTATPADLQRAQAGDGVSSRWPTRERKKRRPASISGPPTE